MIKYLFLLLSFIVIVNAQNTAVYPGSLPDHDDITVLANSARDELNGSITASATSIILTDASEFFSPGANEAGLIKIDNEIIKYCTISTNTLTVCSSGRAFDGTSAAAHNDGATVLGIYASHHHNQLGAELVAIADSLGPVTVVASLPGSPTDGDLARVTDGSTSTDCTTGGGTAIVLCMYDSGAAVWATIAPNHNILSTKHSDSLTASVVLGDTLHGNATPAWARLAGNTTAGKQFLTQTGTGSISAVPSWDNLITGASSTNDILSADSVGNPVVADTGNATYSSSLLTIPGLKVVSGGIIVDSSGTFGTGSGTAFGDGDTQIYESADDTLRFRIGTSDVFAIDTNELNSLKGGDGSPRLRFAAGAMNVPNYTFKSDNDSGMYRIAANNIGFSVGAQKFLELGGSQTALIENPTATTGITLGVVKAGAGQSANHLWEWQSSAGTVLVAVGGTGGINVDVGGAFGAGSGYSFGDGNTEWYERSDNTLTAYVGGSEIFAIDTNELNSLKGDDGSIRMRFIAGADNVPNYTFKGDNNTGMYRVAADNLGFSVGGAKVFELGGSQTAWTKDPTTTTGNTEVLLVEGDSVTNDLLQLLTDGNVEFMSFSSARGLDTTTGTITFADSANVASATTTALGTGNLFHITGTTTITTVNTCDAANNGRLLTLIFDGILTFTDGNNLKLAGNFVTTADDAIQLICDGVNWYEISRSVN